MKWGNIECMFVCVCMFMWGGKGDWEECSEGNEHQYVMHAHAHPQARRFESKSFRNAKQHCPHASASSSAVVPGNCGGWAADSSEVSGAVERSSTRSHWAPWRCPLYSKWAAGFGKKGAGKDTLLTGSRAKLLHSPRTLRTLSRTKTTSPITSGRREETALPVPFLQASWRTRWGRRAVATRPRKDRRTSGATLWCSRQIRQGNRVPFWQYDSTAASKPCVFCFFPGRNQARENPRSLVALVLV